MIPTQPTISNWVFGLTNFSVALCDEKTEIPRPKNVTEVDLPPGWLLNRIELQLEKRKWILIDETVGRHPPLSSEIKGSAALIGKLYTEKHPEDDISELRGIADQLCMILSFAIARDVVAADIYQQISDKICLIESRSTHVHLFNQGGPAIIDNHEKGDLKRFIESAYPIVKGDSGWWLKTLDFFVQARMSRFLEIQSALFNILLDRISGAFPENLAGAEIDQQLRNQDVKVAQDTPTLESLLQNKTFREEITKVFSNRLPTWDKNLTDRYITSYLSNCNSRPSFADGIKRVCRKYNEPEPTGAFLRTRNSLLHQGNLNPSNGDVVEYVRTLGELAARLLLRMLEYSGHYYDSVSKEYRRVM